jgi:sulfate-transporting ATPase
MAIAASVVLATPVLSAQTARFALLGLATGSLVALVALSVVLVHRTSGVLNFSAGAFGGVAAFFFYSMRDTHGVPWVLALVIALLVGAALGAATHYVLFVLRASSLLAKLIATLALMAMAQGAIVILFGDDKGAPDSILPTKLVRLTSNLPISEDRLLIVGLSVVLAVLLSLFYGRTVFGLATSAVSESRLVASATGWSPSRVELVNFCLAGVLSAMAAILLAPILTLSGGALALVIVPALAAAMVGRFSAFTATVLAAMVIGILQSWTSLFQDDIAGSLGVDPTALAGLPEAVPLLVIILVMVARGARRPTRNEAQARLPIPGDGRINWVLLVVGLVLGSLALAMLSNTWADAFIVMFGSGVVILSIVVVTGLGGQLSLAQYALAGFGCWVAARLAATQGWPFWLAVIVGILGTVPMGLVVALPALRTRGINLAVATLVLALMVQSLIFSNGPLTGGFAGTVVEPPSLLGINIDPITHPQRYGAFAMLAFLAAGFVVANVRRGHVGLRLMAVRGNERAAAAVGVRIYAAKLYAFGLAAAIAALGGILLGFHNTNIQFDVFSVTGSIAFILNAVIGGVGWVSGAVIGAILVPGAVGARVWSSLFSNVTELDSYLMMLSGAVAVITLRTAPDGLAALHSHMLHPLKQRLGKHQWLWGGQETIRTEPEGASTGPGRLPLTLSVQNVSVAFGGVVALSDVSFSVAPGEIVGLMGPNGAGKTTMLDVITGFTKARAGEVLIDGESINTWAPETRARAGLGRSWQSVELFEEMSVLENLLVAADPKRGRHYLTDLVRPGVRVMTSAMQRVVAEFQLEDRLAARPSELPQGVGRLVGIARAIVAEPGVLLLDEPAAGLDGPERAELADVIRSTVERRGIGVLLVEHDVQMLLSLCDRIVVLDFGRQIATGTPDEVAADPAVVAAYLGEGPSAAGDDASLLAPSILSVPEAASGGSA